MLSRKKTAELLERAERARSSGLREEAAATYRRLLRANPADVDALYLLGTLLAEAGELDAADALLRQAQRLRPGSDLVMANLGTLARVRGDLEAGIAWYERALAVAPGNLIVTANLGSAYLQAGRDADAEPLLRRALVRPANPFAARCLLGDALRGQHRLEEAAEQYREALALEPNAVEVRHALAACTGEAPESAPPAYARKVFDAYAGRYDAHYGDALASNGPAELAAAVERRCAGRTDWRALDLGCGTGLAAAALRPRCARLVGVDVSPGMLAVARARGLYDQLVQADVRAWLREAEPGAFDLLVAQDVYPYLGALTEPWREARRVAAPGAVLVCTLERAEAGEWQLGAGVRYAHAESHVRQAAADSGWTVLALEPFPFRRDAQGWTPGWRAELGA